MATAPTPGASQPQKRIRFRMRVKDRTLELPDDLSMQERFAVRAATSVAFEAFVSSEAQIGEDSFMVLWWLARRNNGEAGLPFSQAQAEWVPLRELAADEFECEQVVDDGAATDDPGKSGPA